MTYIQQFYLKTLKIYHFTIFRYYMFLDIYILQGSAATYRCNKCGVHAAE